MTSAAGCSRRFAGRWKARRPPWPIEPPGPPLPVEQQVKVLGIWRRFLLFLAQVFGGRDREDVIRQWLLRDLEQEVQQQGERRWTGGGASFWNASPPTSRPRRRRGSGGAAAPGRIVPPSGTRHVPGDGTVSGAPPRPPYQDRGRVHFVAEREQRALPQTRARRRHGGLDRADPAGRAVGDAPGDDAGGHAGRPGDRQLRRHARLVRGRR